MAIIGEPLFDYKGIARNALEGIGLDPKYMQEPLPGGMTLGDEIQPSTIPVEGISLGEEINYSVPEGSELIPDYVNGIAESLVKRKEQLKGTVESYESGESNMGAEPSQFSKTAKQSVIMVSDTNGRAAS